MNGTVTTTTRLRERGRRYLASRHRRVGLLEAATARLMIFTNDRKRTEKDPDFVAFIVPNEAKPDADDAGGGSHPAK